MNRISEIKNKYLGSYLLKENRNEDLLWLIARVEKLEKALEFYAQKPEPDITSEFAKSAEEWGECCATWEPLVDLGQKAREALATEGLEQGDSEEDG